MVGLKVKLKAAVFAVLLSAFSSLAAADTIAHPKASAMEAAAGLIDHDERRLNTFKDSFSRDFVNTTCPDSSNRHYPCFLKKAEELIKSGLPTVKGFKMLEGTGSWLISRDREGAQQLPHQVDLLDWQLYILNELSSGKLKIPFPEERAMRNWFIRKKLERVDAMIASLSDKRELDSLAYEKARFERMKHHYKELRAKFKGSTEFSVRITGTPGEDVIGDPIVYDSN